MIIVDSLANQQFTNLSVCKSLHDKFDSYFIYYMFFLIDKWCITHTNQGGLLSVDIIGLRKLRFSAPTKPEQAKIAGFLRLVDERIAAQRGLIEDYKRLKAAIVEKLYDNNKEECFPIGDYIEQTSKRNGHCCSNVLSVSNRQGFICQSEQFKDRTVASEDTSNYKIVERDDFAFNPARINVGSIARLSTFERGIVSPMYICFRTKDNLLPEYLEYYFESKQFLTEIQKRLEGSVRQCLSYEGLCNIPLCIPTIETQQKIGKRLSCISSNIGLEMDFLKLLQKQKQYLLSQMFI